MIELRDFTQFFFSFVKTSAEIRRLIPPEEQESTGPGEFEVIKYDFSRHRAFVNEIMLSRAVESFNLYLVLILRDIYLSRPEMLKSNDKINVSSIVDAGSYENVIGLLVEKKLNELSYESLRALREYIKDRTNLDLFGDDAAFQATLLASEIRNLIAHNDCVLNAVFAKKTEGFDLPLPVSNRTIQITDEWLRRTSYTLDRVVFRFDELVSKKFGLTVHDSAKILKSEKLPRQGRHAPVPSPTEVDKHRREDRHGLKITVVRQPYQDRDSAVESWRVHHCSGGYIKKRD